MRVIIVTWVINCVIPEREGNTHIDLLTYAFGRSEHSIQNYLFIA